jgi:hypothetical protein
MRLPFLGIFGLLPPALIGAQSSAVRIVGTDRVPVPYALVTVEGATPSITNAQGEVGIGKRRNVALKIEVRRIGYRVLDETIDFPDTAATRWLTLSRVTQELPAVTVSAGKSNLELTGFYDRWLDKQKGGLRNSTFIGPEVIEQRNASVTTDLLSHVIGVTLRVDAKGVRSARGIGDRPKVGVEIKPGATSMNIRGECFMNVLVDSREVCSNVGCHYVFSDDPAGSPDEDHAVDLDKRVDVKQIAGIEVYPSRDGMPDDVRKHYNGCGVIQIWTKR